MYKSFRNFVEEKESNPHPYISALEDEFGIDSRDLEKEPLLASFFAFGDGNISNIGPYKILSFKRNEDGQITHAVVSQNSDSSIKNRQYKDKDGNILRVNNQEDRKFVVSIQDLDKLMSQDFAANQQQGSII